MRELSDKIVLITKFLELTWANYDLPAESGPFHLLIWTAKQFILIMTSFDSIVFN